MAAATSSVARSPKTDATSVATAACTAVSSSRPSDGRSAVAQQPATGELDDQAVGIREVGAVADRGDESVGVDGAVELVGQSERDPLGLGQPGPVEVAEQQRVEGLLGLADELGSEGRGHGRLHLVDIVGHTNDTISLVIPTIVLGCDHAGVAASRRTSHLAPEPGQRRGHRRC